MRQEERGRNRGQYRGLRHWPKAAKFTAFNRADFTSAKCICRCPGRLVLKCTNCSINSKKPPRLIQNQQGNPAPSVAHPQEVPSCANSKFASAHPEESDRGTGKFGHTSAHPCQLSTQQLLLIQCCLREKKGCCSKPLTLLSFLPFSVSFCFTNQQSLHLTNRCHYKFATALSWLWPNWQRNYWQAIG